MASNELQRLVEMLYEQNTILGKARDAYLRLEAGRKHFESLLVSGALGKSHADKVTKAQSTMEWLAVQEEIAKAESVFEFQKLKMSIIEKEWQSVYLETKLNDALIKRG